MKSSKHVETCFVRSNNDFDDKLTAFWRKKNFGQKSPQTDTVDDLRARGQETEKKETINSAPIWFGRSFCPQLHNLSHSRMYNVYA